MYSDGFENLLIIFVIGLFVAAIIAFIFLAKKSSERAKQSEVIVNQLMSQLPSDKQSLFMVQYQNVKKNPTTAVVLALFLGGVGCT